MEEYKIELILNHEMKVKEDFQIQIKNILIKENNSFIPSLYHRIEYGDTLEEKVEFRLLERLSHGYHYIVIFKEERILGYTEILVGDSIVYGELLYGINVGTSIVDNEFQGKGIGKLLYNRLDELAKEFGVDVVLRSTWSLNSRQLSLYNKYGYSEIERIHNARGEGNDLLKFCKYFK